MASARSLYSLTCRDNIDAYIQQYIQADEPFLRSVQATINTLVSLLQNNVPEELRPSQVVKGGSLCKGTSIKGSSDIDLVLMLARYETVRQLKEALPRLLRLLHSSLQQFPNVSNVGETGFGVQLEYTGGDGNSHEIDVLLAVDAITNYKGVNNVYKAMEGRDKDIRANYSACLVPLHADLFGDENPTKLKSLIRLVKYWKKERDGVYKQQHRGQRNARWPTSYVIEIVTMDAWCRAGKPSSFDMRKALYAVLVAIDDHRQFKIILEDHFLNYGRTAIERPNNGPYIMDPCNPFNNLYLTAGQRTAWNWDAIGQEARTFRGKALFQNMSYTSNSW